MAEKRIAEIQKKLEETTEMGIDISKKMYKAFSENKTKDVDLDFVKTMTNSLRTTVKSAGYEILAYRVATDRLR